MHLLNELCVFIALAVLFVAYVPGTLLIGALLRIGTVPGKFLSVMLLCAGVGLLNLLYAEPLAMDTRQSLQLVVACLYGLGFAVASYAERSPQG